VDRYTLVPEFNSLIPKFLSPENVFGVYEEETDSVSENIVKTLQEKGYQVKKVSQEIPSSINVLCIIASPEAAWEKIKTSGVQKIWLEPGSESQAAIDYCQKNKIELVYYHSLTKAILDSK